MSVYLPAYFISNCWKDLNKIGVYTVTESPSLDEAITGIETVC
jgi:hypothetical protein